MLFAGVADLTRIRPRPKARSAIADWRLPTSRLEDLIVAFVIRSAVWNFRTV